MYKVKGADQRDYGPISADQVQQWIAENRLNKFSLAQRESEPGWKPLSQFPEFEKTLRAQSPPAPSESAPAAPSPAPAAPSPAPAAAPAPNPAPSPSPSAPLWGPATSPPYSQYRSQPSPSTRESAAALVNGPSIGLIVCGALGLLVSLVNIPIHLLGNSAVAVPENITDPQMRQFMATILEFSGRFGIISAVLGIPWNALILFGGIKMRALEKHSLCFASAILAAIPCFSGCCCVTLPIGIWAAIVLAKPEVKEHFQ